MPSRGTPVHSQLILSIVDRETRIGRAAAFVAVTDDPRRRTRTLAVWYVTPSSGPRQTPAMHCPEAVRLEQTLSAAAAAYRRAVGELSNWQDHELGVAVLPVLLAAVEKARLAAENARLALESHRVEHG